MLNRPKGTHTPPRRRWTHALASLLAVGFIAGTQGQGTQAEDRPLTPQAQAAWTLHLLEQARYGEAIPAAQALVGIAPNDPFSYQVRGTLELYTGSAGPAQDDFHTASSLSPHLPVTDYGLALCAMFANHLENAQAQMALVRKNPALTPSQMDDADTVQAYLRYLHGDVPGAIRMAQMPLNAPQPPSAAPDPMRRQLVALAVARLQPQQGMALLADYLSTPGGVPRVREAEGLRARFETAPFMVEPAVMDVPLQQMYQASLAEKRTVETRSAKGAAQVTGDVTLDAQLSSPKTPTFVAFYVDGQMTGMVNTSPYRYEWHSEDVPNGWHIIRTEALDGSGAVITSQSRRVQVRNAGTPAAVPIPSAAWEARVWALLKLRPARKAAEWAQAGLADQRGDREDAQAHRAVAAALDPNYKDARWVARTLFSESAARVTPPPVRLASTRPEGLWIGDTTRKEIAITFDDGPNPDKTPALLNALESVHAPATFFVVGSRAEAAPALVRRMTAMGDDVEDHSYTHPNMAQTPPTMAETEILRASVVIRALTGRQPHFFRPPGGNISPAVISLSHAYGQQVAYWTVDALHAEDIGSRQGLIDYVMAHIHPGAIVLMHNGTDVTTSAVPDLVKAMRAKGYHLVTLSNMTAKTSPVKNLPLKE